MRPWATSGPTTCFNSPRPGAGRKKGFLTILPLADNPTGDQETEQVTDQVAGQVYNLLKVTPGERFRPHPYLLPNQRRTFLQQDGGGCRNGG
ncbi:MAG TPA: hypothetical protein ENN98_01355 [Desulfurivibrio alkaliphilus]|uniref:Uncharacterized protein n=1 Tax=Desulfurivibrio alkaliphilus TaxID=427923 RepID=A0A7C2XNE4_9BACT|nr:hypothetical protein [Desulfurivibrio alkaliphilus]